jgi:tetratricopeptide (TPR) repeat protein
LDAEQPNTRAAIDFLLESGDGDAVVRLLAAPWAYWTERPYPRDLRRWLEAALAISSETPNHQTILALGLLVNATSFLGDHESAAATASRQLQWATAIGTPMALGLAWFWQGITADFTGDVERASISFEQALEFQREAGYIFPVLESMLEIGSVSLIAGRVEQAVAVLDESLIVAREAGSETELAYGLLYRGFAALAQQAPALAAQFFEDGLRQAQRYQMDRVTLGAIGGLTGVTLALCQPEVAARLLGAVEAARQSSGVGRICQAFQVDAIASQTVEHLGQEAYDACVEEGSTTTYQEAIDTALAVAAAAREATRT